jgi:hypothetical protein
LQKRLTDRDVRFSQRVARMRPVSNCTRSMPSMITFSGGLQAAISCLTASGSRIRALMNWSEALEREDRICGACKHSFAHKHRCRCKHKYRYIGKKKREIVPPPARRARQTPITPYATDAWRTRASSGSTRANTPCSSTRGLFAATGTNERAARTKRRSV